MRGWAGGLVATEERGGAITNVLLVSSLFVIIPLMVIVTPGPRGARRSKLDNPRQPDLEKTFMMHCLRFVYLKERNEMILLAMICPQIIVAFTDKVPKIPLC